MESDALVLGFDTSAAHCAAALLSGDRLVSARSEELGRGQAERLMPLLEEVLAKGGARWSDLARIGVGVGPGNFTGIRISVSAARGLALALGIPAVGVSTFEAIAQWADGPHLPVVPAPQDNLYIQQAGEEPRLVTRSEAAAIGQTLTQPPEPALLAEAIARRAAKADDTATPPAPLYIRPADATPRRETPLVILDDDA